MCVKTMTLLFAVSTVVSAIGAESAQTDKTGESTQIASSDWRMTIRMDKDVVKAGSEVKVLIEAKNISDHAILVTEELKNPRRIDLRYKTYVRAADGSLAPETKWGRRVRTGREEPGESTIEVGSSYERYIQPGQIRPETLVLNALYDLSEPGKYSVQIEIPDEQGHVILRSNIVTFMVTK
jgi:hypothetical protein